jgi:HAD superfamily hydrolase (TIGR01509 family)
MTTRMTDTIRGVIFDMDGVLVDSEPVHVEATRLLLSDRGIRYEPSDEENFFGCTDREVFRALRARYGIAADEHELGEAWIARVVELLPGRLVPMPGVPEVLDALRSRGYRLALASSSAPPVIATTITGLGLQQAFEVTVSGREVGKGKPAPDIFLEAARRLALAPADCVVVEDSSNGLRAAVAARIPCVVVPCGSTAHHDFSGAAVRLATLRDLPAWLANGASR